MRPGERSTLISKNKIYFRARTGDRWITGHVITTHRRLGDVLNRDDTGGILVAEEVTVVNAARPSDGESETFPYASINTSAAFFFIPIEDGPAPARDSFAWIKKRPERVRVGVGPYEIAGDLYLIEDAKLRETLAAVRPRFLVLAAAIIRRVDGPDTGEEQAAVFVNRSCVEFMTPVIPAP